MFYYFLELEDFIQNMKVTHGATYTAPLLSSSSNLGIVDSQLRNELSLGISASYDTEPLMGGGDAVLGSEISSSIPPRLPDFAWRDEQTLTFELVDS
jgi:hypothetical protein